MKGPYLCIGGFKALQRFKELKGTQSNNQANTLHSREAPGATQAARLLNSFFWPSNSANAIKTRLSRVSPEAAVANAQDRVYYHLCQHGRSGCGRA